jgi:hypothetical protein
MVITGDLDAALSRITGNSRSDKFARNSLLAMREKFAPSRPPLKVILGGDRVISANELSTITAALQEATARMAMLILHPNEDHTRVTEGILQRSQLIARSQVANTLHFDFPQPVATLGDALPIGNVAHLAELAMKDLIQVLPTDRDDSESIMTLPGRREGTRAAVSGLAKAVEKTGAVTLTLTAHGAAESDTSTLTVEQARQVPTVLDSAREDSTVIPVEGELDGFRTRRLMFYFLEDDDRGGHEYQGSVERDQLPLLQQALGHRVRARLRKTIYVRGDGSRSRPVYSLVSLEPIQPLPDSL